MSSLDGFREVWLVDFEFTAPPGCRPRPLCLAAREWRSGRRVRAWLDGVPAPEPPYPLGADTLFVAFHAPAELGCHLALGWQMPARVLDLRAEFLAHTSGRDVPCGRGLLGAMAYHGLDAMAGAEKEAMQQLAMRGGPYTSDEVGALLDYCQKDADAPASLLSAMLPRLDVPRALIRGRYTAAVARMEWAGVPVDVPLLGRLRSEWDGLRAGLIARVDADYRVFDGLTFKADRFAAFLARNNIPWPLLTSGALDMSDDTFRQMAKAHPLVAPLRELRHALAQLRLNELAVGPDGRNRVLLWPFSSKTGRNQPSNSRFLFGPSRWIRGLIRPADGMAVAYVDWAQQEFGIAGALSGDGAMMEAYRSGDPYLAFAKQAGAAPADATRRSHPTIRDQFKQCVLAVQYGQGEAGLAQRLGVPVARARELMARHRAVYRRYWAWSDAVEMYAMLRGRLHTVFGWPVHVGQEANPRSLRNFPMQANGAEMMRLACSLATERGVTVCCPVHDALLVEGPADRIEEVVATTQAAMKEASRQVLGGFELASDAKVVQPPGRYMDDAGRRMWDTVMEALGLSPGGA